MSLPNIIDVIKGLLTIPDDMEVNIDEIIDNEFINNKEALKGMLADMMHDASLINKCEDEDLPSHAW